MDALGQLTGGIAHDFNNLLAAVLGGLGLIERRATLADDQRKVLEMTRHAAQQGAELVSRLLAFARRQKLEPACIDMDDLAGAVSQLLAHTLGGLVALEWELQDDQWSPYADEAQLELALMNLAINARDAMPEGGQIRIACRNAVLAEGDDAPAGDYVVLAVSDTGCGIAPEMLERVTEPFFTTKAVGKGTGLGLSMVYGFAQQSGGTMRIDSRLDQGTTVELWLPRAPAALRRAPASPRAADPATRNRARHILLVDDHDGVRATTAAMLEDLGHRVVTATDGEHVSRLIQDEDLHAVDFIISDYAMPLVSGSEVIRKLRSVKPGLPGIIISGYADKAAISGAPEGVIVVSKPFTPAQLQDAIAAAAHARG
jgi:CheY-like chemotaxis protein